MFEYFSPNCVILMIYIITLLFFTYPFEILLQKNIASILQIVSKLIVLLFEPKKIKLELLLNSYK